MWGEREREREKIMYETSIAIKSQNGYRGNPALPPRSFCHHLPFHD